MSKALKSGYTTGTHATALLVAILYDYYEDKVVKSLEVHLPKDVRATISVRRKEALLYTTIKTDNDDLDVTKGCEITLNLLKQEPQGLQEQKPSLLTINKTKIYVYAGVGVGVVTKKGLKIAPYFPAINPTPLDMMVENSLHIVGETEDTFYAIFSVKNGLEIAKQTANEKVGVVGGISILGTRGVVKPISSDAYLDSIEAEISVVNASNMSTIVYTLGNTAHDYANANYDAMQVVEIGNFIYDASLKLQNTQFQKMVFISSVAKMCKIAQECKNTHNRFGGIDFDEVKLWLKGTLDINLGNEEYQTLKAVLTQIGDENSQEFTSFLGYKASQSFEKWFRELKINIKSIEIITINGKNISKRERKW